MQNLRSIHHEKIFVIEKNVIQFWKLAIIIHYDKTRTATTAATTTTTGMGNDFVDNSAYDNDSNNNSNNPHDNSRNE